MFLSIFQKSKTILGIGVKSENSNNDVVPGIEATCLDSEYQELDEESIKKRNDELKDAIYDYIRNIRDPEKPASLEDLHVVYEDGVMIEPSTEDNVIVVRIEFNPTVPHCSLATLIGLCIRVKLERNLVDKFKLDIYIKEGAHSTEDEINKQINDKERVAAAMENPTLRELVESCITEDD